ncbi:MAG: sigma-70 family RNA polymerase sigma factor [Desulfobacterales bacterium]|nr:sigma-70 family RNA polymerase sigma factor [Desulfobacterales bacterium]
MKHHQKHMDYDLAHKICHDLRSGYRSAIIELYNRYAHLFAAFARHRLFDDDPHAIESVLSTFWLELLNGRAICKYNGRASLQTYLTVILNRRIIDANRKFAREHNTAASFNDSEAGVHSHDRQTPETELIGKEQRKLIQKALLRLSDQSPRDANLIRMNLEGLNYEQMAVKELTGKRSDPQGLKRKVEAIKKQFTRKETGSMAKFKMVLNRFLDTNGLDYTDLFNG